VIGSLLRIRYEVLQELEESAIFKAYRVRDRVGGREVKVRLIQPPFGQEPAFLERIQEVISESHAAPHPNLEKLLELDEHEGTPFIVSELPMGAVLADRVRKLAPFSAPVVLQIAIGVCEALAPVHDLGHAHGDVSTGTLFVNQENRVKVGLTGMWKAYGASRTAAIVVLPEMAPYLAPEVTQGAMPNPSSDVYSLGVVMYELLTGRLPFSADTPVAMAMKHSTAPVPSIRISNPGAPAVLDEVIRKAMAKTPHDRYPSARAFLSDLRKLLDALKFGKQVSWPIKESVMPAAVPVSAAEPKRLTPAESAIRREKPRPVDEDIEPDDEIDMSDGLPRWLLVIGYLALLMVVVLVGGYFAWNLSRPSEVRVPNIVGQSAIEASEQLEQLKLKLVVKEVESDKPEGTILKMDPGPESKRKEGSPIYATVSMGSRFVEVPDIRGRSLEEAKSFLTKIGLKVDPKIRERSSLNFEKGTVVDQRPAPRQRIQKSSAVAITVSSGEAVPKNVDSGTVRKLYRLKVGPLELEDSVVVRIEMIDDRFPGGKVLYEARNQPNDLIQAEEVGYGTEVTFKVFYDGQPVTQFTQRADAGEPVE